MSRCPTRCRCSPGSLSAGYSLPQALDNVAREAGGPMSEELNRALLESRLGMPLEESLDAAALRMHSEDFHWVVMAVRINRQVGGNLAEVLTNVSRTIRERERLRRQVKALSAEGVLSAWVLGLLPVAIGAFVALTRPDYLTPLFTTSAGSGPGRRGAPALHRGPRLDAQPRPDRGLTDAVLGSRCRAGRPVHRADRDHRPGRFHHTRAQPDRVLAASDRVDRGLDPGQRAQGVRPAVQRPRQPAGRGLAGLRRPHPLGSELGEQHGGAPGQGRQSAGLGRRPHPGDQDARRSGAGHLRRWRAAGERQPTAGAPVGRGLRHRRLLRARPAA